MESEMADFYLFDHPGFDGVLKKPALQRIPHGLGKDGQIVGVNHSALGIKLDRDVYHAEDIQ